VMVKAGVGNSPGESDDHVRKKGNFGYKAHTCQPGS